VGLTTLHREKKRNTNSFPLLLLVTCLSICLTLISPSSASSVERDHLARGTIGFPAMHIGRMENLGKRPRQGYKDNKNVLSLFRTGAFIN
jgi:hypothetical protein